MKDSILDLTGRRFGKLVVQGLRGSSKSGLRWICVCDCGARKDIIGHSLKIGATKSCGCYNKECHRNMARNYAGKTFNRWTGISRVGTSGSKWLWQCACGTKREIGVGSVTKGYTKSCGCYRDEMAVKTHQTHGKSKTSRAYTAWEGMKQRCFNHNYRQFKDYGGRGITVCEDWKNSFESFLRDMGEPPQGLTLERENNNGNYEKSNCTWATRDQQSKNRRTQYTEIPLTLKEATMTIRQWARFLGIPMQVINARYLQGLPIEQVLAK